MQNIPAFTPEDEIDNKITSYLDQPRMNSETNPLVW